MKRISAVGGAVLALAILAACGGGGSSSGAPPVPPGPPATSTPAPSGSSFSSSDAVAIPSAAPGAATVPVPLSSDAGGASANAAIPASASIPTDATVASTFSTTADAGLPALSVQRQARSSKTVRDDSNGTKPIAYLRMIFSTDVTLPQAPAFTFTVPGTLPTDAAYWLAFYDPQRAAAGWQKGFEGPAVLSSTTSNGHAATKLVFASNNQPISFLANQPYYFVVIAVSPTTSTPTPVPTSVPTNSPPPATKPAPVLASPPNVQFDSVTASSPVPVTFSEQGFTGSFTLHGDCTGIVNTSGVSPTWTLTPVGAGRCVIVALGDRGATAVVHVGVVTQFETPHPTSSASPSPTRTPEPSHTPRPSDSPEPSRSPEPSHSPEPSSSPGATEPPHQTEPPHPSTTPRPSPTATPSHSPEPTEPPHQTEPPHPSPTPTATPRPSTTASPTPNPNEPTPTPTPTPTPGTGTHAKAHR
jgi:hypothetical protein